MGEAVQEDDVVDVLTSDHREMSALIGAIRLAQATQEKRDLADTLIAEIVRHAVAEEMFVYPAMRDHVPGGDEAVEHDIDEHKQIERILKTLEGVAADDLEFESLVQELDEQLAHHATDEESEQFPQLRSHIAPEKLVKLAQQVQLAKTIAPTRPHPAAPNSALFHFVAGPGVGLVDRLRDKLTGRTTDA